MKSDSNKNSRKGRVVLVGGVFDILHIGHIDFFKAAKKQGDYLIVALESDDLIKHSKKRVPVHSQQQRVELLSHIDLIDEVVQLPSMNGYEDYMKLVKEIRPHVIAVTLGEPYLAEKQKQAELVGAKVVPVIDRIPGFSTTEILKHYSD